MTKKNKYLIPFDLSSLSLAEKEILDTFQKEMRGESNRATAIVGQAYIHEILKKLLEKRLIDSKDLSGDIEKLNYKSCIKLCLLTGIISKKEKEILEIIGLIRNKFAHTINIHSFDYSEVKEYCDKIRSRIKCYNAQNGTFKFDTPRNIYLSAVYLNILILLIRIKSCKKIEFWLHENKI